MNCPKCGKELLNVNGKYVCVDCGIEVPENQSGVSQTVPVEGKEENPVPAAEPEASMTPQSTMTDIPNEPEEIAPQANASVSVEEALKSDEGEVPEGLQAVPEPVPAPAPTPEMTPEPEVPAEMSPTETAPESATAPADSPVDMPSEETVASPPAPEIPAAEPALDVPEVVSAPAAKPTPAPEIPPPDPFDAADNGAAQTASATMTAPAQAGASGQIPSATSFTPPPQAQPMQPDATIFQDPMYDNGGMSSGMPTVSEVEKEEKSGKKITVILIIGVVIAILLAAGGFAAYKFLI